MVTRYPKARQHLALTPVHWRTGLKPVFLVKRVMYKKVYSDSQQQHIHEIQHWWGQYAFVGISKG